LDLDPEFVSKYNTAFQKNHDAEAMELHWVPWKDLLAAARDPSKKVQITTRQKWKTQRRSFRLSGMLVHLLEQPALNGSVQALQGTFRAPAPTSEIFSKAENDRDMDMRRRFNALTTEQALASDFRHTYLESRLNGLVLDIDEAVTTPGAKLVMWGKKNKPNQKWRFTPEGCLESALNGLLLTAQDNKSLTMRPKEGADNQLWRLTDEGYLESALGGQGLVLDIDRANKRPGAKLILWKKEGRPNQKWQRTHLGGAPEAAVHPDYVCQSSVKTTRVRILHISDTHSMHRQIEAKFGKLPDADILIHTGDFTNSGSHTEFKDFNEWLGSLQTRYEDIIVILGNHEFQNNHAISRSTTDPNYAKNTLTNARVLEHELVTVKGLRIFGSSWVPWQDPSNPDDDSHTPKGFVPAPNFFGQIPENVDVLLSHGPPYRIFDKMEHSSQSWGSSRRLRERIEQVKPRVHLFGHVHEQRGVWVKRDDGVFVGGVEYQAKQNSAEPWSTFTPPPTTYPCELISCNAMTNHSGLEGRDPCIAGPARLVVATRSVPGLAKWSFAAN
jgi:Icc-related predicted phosphoesterase